MLACRIYAATRPLPAKQSASSVRASRSASYDNVQAIYPSTMGTIQMDRIGFGNSYRV